MITSKQRAFLKKLSQHMDPIVHIGKEGMTKNILKQADDALEARELIKGTVQQNSDISAREACDIMARELGAEGISVLGRKFVLYRESQNKKKIDL